MPGCIPVNPDPNAVISARRGSNCDEDDGLSEAEDPALTASITTKMMKMNNRPIIRSAVDAK